MITTLLTDSFVVIDQSFQLTLSGRCPGDWATNFLFVVDCPSKLHTIYSIINSLSGETFYFKVIHNLCNQNFDPFSKLSILKWNFYLKLILVLSSLKIIIVLNTWSLKIMTNQSLLLYGNLWLINYRTKVINN